MPDQREQDAKVAEQLKDICLHHEQVAEDWGSKHWRLRESRDPDSHGLHSAIAGQAGTFRDHQNYLDKIIDSILNFELEG